jgi:Spy/CpxP family protein refolding chaperone
MSISNIRRSVLVAVGIVAVAAAGLFAGRLAAGSMSEGGHGFGPHGGFGPQRLFEHLADRLELNDAQREQVRAILRGRSGEIEAQMHAGAEAGRALHEAVQAELIDEAAIRDRAAELGRVHGEGAILCARIRAEVLPILTADQKAKLKTMHERMRGHGRHGARAFSEWLRSHF